MLKVLGRKTSGNVQKVIFALEEMGAQYEREDYGRQFNNTQTPEYKAMNPTAKVPTVVDGDVVMFESNTILWYLADTRGRDYMGADAAENTEVSRWMDFLLASVNYGYVTAFKGAKLDPAERPAGFDETVKDLYAQLAILDAHLKGKDYVALGKLTIADFALAPIVGRCLGFPLERPELPSLQAWFDKVSALPSYQTATG